MGEAKVKDTKRRAHAAYIVNAFEQHILSLTREYDTKEEGQAAYEKTRGRLIEVLVTPPPK